MLSGSQAGITVSPAAFSGYRLSVPNGADSKGHILVSAGEAISLTVRASDAFGNTLTGYAGGLHRKRFLLDLEQRGERLF